jgi:predicted peptidase
MPRHHLLALLLPLVSLWPHPANSQEQPGTQTAARLDADVNIELGYLIYLPKDYDQQEQWPLLLFLHGAGERGDNLDMVKVHGPPKLVAAGQDMPFIVVSPQCPAGRWWEPVELTALLDEVSAKHKVDPDRIYVTGLSMGGFGTWQLASHIPDRLAAIAPICGGGEPLQTRGYSHLPVWAFHGAKDEVVPLSRSEVMIEALKGNGADPKFTVYPEAGHDSWTETYDNPELYEWFLSHERKA